MQPVWQKTRWLATNHKELPRGTNINMLLRPAKMEKRRLCASACVDIKIIFSTKTREDVLTSRPGTTAPRRKTNWLRGGGPVITTGDQPWHALNHLLLPSSIQNPKKQCKAKASIQNLITVAKRCAVKANKLCMIGSNSCYFHVGSFACN